MRILVTAGPTREYFDSVRFISNASSGKMGYAIATQAVRRGHQVVLVSGPVNLSEPRNADVIHVTSAREMFDAAVAAFEHCDAALMAAAVCDYRPARRLTRKSRKQGQSRTVNLAPNRDICAYLGRIKRHRALVGFALEDRDARAHAEAKLRRKRCDAIVLNRLDALGADSTVVEILRADGGWSKPLREGKMRIARALIALVESLVSR